MWQAIAAVAAGTLLIAGVSLRRTGIALLAAGLIAFQAALLAVTVAGPVVGYQHLRAPLAAWRHAPAAVAILAASAVFAAFTLAARRAEVAGWVRTAHPRAVAAALAAMTVFAAVPSLVPTAWLTEMVTATMLQLAALVLVSAAAASVPGHLARRLTSWLEAEDTEGKADRVTWGLAGAVIVAAALLSILSYQRHPHIPDEVSYLIQARYFAAGMLSMPAPAAPAAFDLDLMTVDAARWYSPFPPGWPAVLAIGVLVKAPWLVNPVLGGVNVVLAGGLFGRLLDRRTARLATVLFAASPWHLFLAMSFMSHTFSLALALAAALALVQVWRGRSAWLAVGGGAALGVLSLNRPLEGAAVAGFLGVLALGIRGPWRFAPATALVAGAVIAGTAGLLYNRAITGEALNFPVMDYFDRTYGPGINSLGFGPERGLPWRGLDPFPGHGLRDVIANAVLNIAAINTELFGWCLGSLAAVVLGITARRPDRTTWLWMASIAVIAGAHSFYWFSGGPDFGARYWFLVIVPAVALAARGVLALDRPGGEGPPRAALGALLLSATALAVFVPWRAADKYLHYRGMRPDIRALAQGNRLDGSVVLVRGRRFPDYASAAVYNPVEPDTAAPLFAWDRDPTARHEVVEAFPGRPYWIIDGPTVTGAGYEIVAGPLDASSLPPAPRSEGARSDDPDGAQRRAGR